MKKSYILLYGYGWSGSGAVLDFLKENAEVQISDHYFLLLRDRGGLIDLQSKLVTNWDMYRSSVAINDFLKLCDRSKKPMSSSFSALGRNYQKQFGKDFDKAIHEFISEICDFRYPEVSREILNYDHNVSNVFRAFCSA